MSYILDALQKAEAEREQGRVPGLKSQILPPNRRERAPGITIRPWHALVGLAVLLTVLIAWWSLSEDAAPASTENAAAAPTAPVPSSGLPLPAAPAPEAAQAPDTPPTPAERSVPRADPVLPILAPARPPPAPPAPPKVSNAPATAVVPAPAATPAAAAAAPAPAVAPAAAPALSTPSTPAAVPSFGQLTAEVRAQLPAVNLSGSTYSKNPSLRMLIANGKVVQEGQDIAPGLRLETIGPRSAVLNHQGMRYSIGY